MDGNRVRVSRDTYRLALLYAIEWQASILETHDPVQASGRGHCTPGDRCQQYQVEARLWRRFRQALRRLDDA